jgi:hypothetical protein
MSPQNLKILEFPKTIKPKWPNRPLSIFKFIIISKTSNAIGHGQRFPYGLACVYQCSSVSLSVFLLSKCTLPSPGFSVFHGRPPSLTSTHFYLILSTFLISQEINNV